MAGQTGGDDGRIVGPHRSAVIAKRVVGPLLIAQRPYSPHRPQIPLHHPCRNLRCPLGGKNARPKTVAMVRGGNPKWMPRTIESQGDQVSIGEPEVGVESDGQRRGGLFQFDGPDAVAEIAFEARQSDEGIVEVALNFGYSKRTRGQRAVSMDHAITRVLPRLITEPAMIGLVPKKR